ncbi:MAG: tRNA (adenosine(37)-N6)-dimethylallyltransferase MiaA, partial [Acidobacteriota bacterium]|nr:tRNA (adenosine(37)-N6)-dimethylallyltransferase MiaA [Acidobacteriota bacterium]
AIRIAREFGGEILNCDSVQVFRYFDIGSAKTPESGRGGIPHHLIDAFDPDELFTAGDFSRTGRAILHRIAEQGRLPVVAGGTGFYVRALIDGLAPGPGRDDTLRARLSLRERRRPGSLHRLLGRFDPRTALRIHPNDVPKTMRALEICLAARRPAADVFEAGRDALQGFRVLKIGLFPEREALYRRLEERLEHMFSSGLVEETAAILARGFPATAKPFESIGYKQALQVVQGELSFKDALYYARRDTRRYAKRQMTWFRQEPGLHAIYGFGDAPAAADLAIALVREFLAR